MAALRLLGLVAAIAAPVQAGFVEFPESTWGSRPGLYVEYKDLRSSSYLPNPCDHNCIDAAPTFHSTTVFSALVNADASTVAPSSSHLSSP